MNQHVCQIISKKKKIPTEQAFSTEYALPNRISHKFLSGKGVSLPLLQREDRKWGIEGDWLTAVKERV